MLGTFRESPAGYRMVPVPQTHDAAYTWLSEQDDQFGILELPEVYGRGWDAPRYMLASKRHWKHLVNGGGRITPDLMKGFLRQEPWTEDFFTFIESYFPVKYVLIHRDELPTHVQEEFLGLLRDEHGWRVVLPTPGAWVFAVDRSSGGGREIERLYLRSEVAPQAVVRFSARWTPRSGPLDLGTPGGRAPATLQFLQDGAPVVSWELTDEWSQHELVVGVEPLAPASSSSWPRTTTRFTWRLNDGEEIVPQLRSISVERTDRE